MAKYFFALAAGANRGKTKTLNAVIENRNGTFLKVETPKRKPTLAIFKTKVNGEEMIVFVQTSSPQERYPNDYKNIFEKDVALFEKIAKVLGLENNFCILMAFNISRNGGRCEDLLDLVRAKYSSFLVELVKKDKPRTKFDKKIVSNEEYSRQAEELLSFIEKPD